MSPDVTAQINRLSRSPREFLAANHQLIRTVVQAIARRSRLCQADCDDFESVVWVRLIERDYRVLRAFRRQCSLRTYLTIVVRRFLLDYRASRWGKWRASAAARRAGAAAMHLERLVLRDGMPIGVAASQVGMPMPDIQVTSRARRAREAVSMWDVPDVKAGPELSPDATLRARELDATAATVRDALTAALTALSREERRLLWLRYARALSISEIAAELGIQSKPLYRVYARIHARLRASLESSGLEREHILTVVGAPQACVDGLLAPAGIAGGEVARPVLRLAHSSGPRRERARVATHASYVAACAF